MKKLILLSLLFSATCKSMDQENENLKKKFAAGFGQGVIAVPMTPVVVSVGVFLSPILAATLYGKLDNWSNSKSNQNKHLSIKCSKGDKAKLAGNVAGYASTVGAAFFILRKLLRK